MIYLWYEYIYRNREGTVAMKNKQSLREKLYEQILEGIMHYEYPPGSIITENELVKIYGTSRLSIREVLIQFCNEGILQSIPRCGYQVKAITQKETRDAYELREILEINALRKTVSIISDEQIDILEREVEESKGLVDEKNMFKHWNHNMKFHLLLCSFCENELLYGALETNLKFCYRSASQYFRNEWTANRKTDASLHAQIVESLRNEEYKKVEELILRDISSRQ